MSPARPHIRSLPVRTPAPVRIDRAASHLDRGWTRSGLAGALCAAALAFAPGCSNGKKAAEGSAEPSESAGSSDPARTPAEGGTQTPARARQVLDLFIFGRVQGQLAPCGCTADPLGGLQYAFGLIEAGSNKGARVVLEPGSLLFPDPEHPEAPIDEAGWAQAKKRADTLLARFGALGGELVAGFGPSDLAHPELHDAEALLRGYPLPRTLANLAADAELPGVARHRSVALEGGVKVVVSAVVDPSEFADTDAAGLPALADPLESARALLAEIPERERALTVLMVGGPRALAEKIARELDYDLVVAGGTPPNPDRGRSGHPYAKVGNSFVVEPGDRGQTLAHLRLQLDAGDPLAALAGAWTVVEPDDKRQRALAQMDEKLAAFRADPAADPAFVARVQRERDALAQSLASAALPDAPAVATFAQLPVSCRGPADASAKQALAAYDAWVAAENAKRFAGVHAPPVPKGQAGYAGIEACADCHQEAVDAWNETKHAGAYETLERANKQFDLSCVGCHVTGFRQPGGSEVVENEGLVDVQCEQCHGPGSLHIEDPSPENISLAVPESVCGQCHTPEHSDTFDYEAYLRDVLMPGHGEGARKKLGEGPTGGQLRRAAIEAAGGACPKM